MKIKMNPIVILALLCSAVANAQPPTSTSTHISEGTVDLSGTGSETRQKLQRLESSVTSAKNELDEITKLIANAKNDCEAEEAELRKRDQEFLLKNKAQIDEIVHEIRKGLKKQLGMLKGYVEGVVESEETEDYINPAGQADQSAIAEILARNTEGKDVIKRIAVKDLIKYIQKFEAEAATISNNQTDIDAFLAKYRSSATEKNPAFFNMTLDQAVTAYSVRLNSLFQVSYQQKHARKFVIGSGKNMFRVTTTTVMGYSPKFNTTVGTMIASQAAATQINLNLVQNFGEAFKQAEEDRYWEILREQQLTIQGIPVDGLLRRKYFDRMRSPNCVRGASYTFNPKSTPGPFLSFQDKEICRKVGIEILSASVTKTQDYNGRAKVGSVFDITSAIQVEAAGKAVCSSSDGFRSIVTALGIGSCDDVRLEVKFRCACEYEERIFNIHYKIGRAISFGCN